MKMTVEERAADIVGNGRFANREKRALAQRIVDFMDIPAYAPVRRLTPVEREIQHYHDQCKALAAHVNCVYLVALIQGGFVP